METENQLKNPKHYAMLQEPIFKETSSMINNILRFLVKASYLKPKQYDYLSAKPDCRERHLYNLPKVHKNPATDYAILQKPIFKETSSMINDILRNLVKASYLKPKKYDYLSAKLDCREILYTLPKIHKNSTTD